MTFDPNRFPSPPGGHGPQIDMTPEGEFVAPPRPSLGARIFGVAVLVAVLAGGLVLAMLALWFALALIPVAIGAALVAILVFRFRMWRARQSFGRNPGAGIPGIFRRS